MKLPAFAVKWLRRRAMRLMVSRAPDFVIGDEYLRRWWVIPRNRLFNIYLHDVRKSDDDRALHDHPWLNCSILLQGGYFEHSIAAGGVEHVAWRGAGDVVLRRSVAAHRLQIPDSGVAAWSLFITGPRMRDWGFHCPKAGWRHWKDFTAADDYGKVGPGCD